MEVKIQEGAGSLLRQSKGVWYRAPLISLTLVNLLTGVPILSHDAPQSLQLQCPPAHT